VVLYLCSLYTPSLLGQGTLSLVYIVLEHLIERGLFTGIETGLKKKGKQ
jgi:hypothetical protein